MHEARRRHHAAARTHLNNTHMAFLMFISMVILKPPVHRLPSLDLWILRRRYDRKRSCEVTILMPIYNKAHYLSLSLPSILRMRINPRRVCTLCYDDGSTDNTVITIAKYQRRNPRLYLVLGDGNRGTLYARIRLIELTRTPWLVFLDPDDELIGSGVAEALDLINKTDSDIVQFGCRMVVRWQRRRGGCWREPINITSADRETLTELWLDGKVDVHLHRKVWRTELFQRAVAAIPEDVRAMRIQRTQDTLLYAYALMNMTRKYRYLPTVGEIRHFGWPDNSQSEAYQSKKETETQVTFVANWTRKLLGRRVVDEPIAPVGLNESKVCHYTQFSSLNIFETAGKSDVADMNRKVIIF
jgi:hypothetical protein